MLYLSIFTLIVCVFCVFLVFRNYMLKNDMKKISDIYESKMIEEKAKDSKNFNDEITNLKLAHSVSVNEIRLELEKEIAQYCTKLENAQINMQDLKEQQKDEIENLKDNFSISLKNLKDEHEKICLAQKQDYDLRLQSQLDSMEKNMKNTLDSLKNEFENKETKFIDNIKEFLEKSGEKYSKVTNDGLKPFWDDIKSFKEELSKNEKENREKQGELKNVFNNAIESITQQSLKIANDANNLANVLKQDKQKQGAWGEMILENILQGSGLSEELNYKKQASSKNDENQLIRPDYIVYLPHKSENINENNAYQKRAIIIDSKVSLVNYEKLVNDESNDEALKKSYRKEFCGNIQSHVNTLSSKKYHDYIQNSERLDFTIMFLPIDGMYFEAWKENKNLMIDSLKKGVLITTPTSLMAVLKVINMMWINDNRDKNIKSILDSCDKLVDKFAKHLETFNSVGEFLDRAKDKYIESKKQLDDGRGSARKHIEDISSMLSKTNYKKQEAQESKTQDNAQDKMQEKIEEKV